MRSGEEHTRMVHGPCLWSMGICMVVGVSVWDWDRIYVVLFTIVKGDFLKHA